MPSPIRLIRRHDQFFKRVLDQPGVPDALLRHGLPSDWLRLWSGGRPEPTVMAPVTARLRELRTDRSYVCPPIQGGPAGLLVLIEHKARPSRAVPWQIADYLHELVRDWCNRRKVLSARERHRQPLAVAIVVYHGRLAWRIPLSLAAMATDDQRLWSMLPDARYHLVDVVRTPAGAMTDQPHLRAAFLIWQAEAARSLDRRQILSDLVRTALGFGLDDLTAVVYYLVGELGEDGNDLMRRVLADIAAERSEGIMQTVGDRLRAEGRVEGLAEGRLEGLAEGRVDMLLRMMRYKFGEPPGAVVARLQAGGSDDLDVWAKRLLEADTLEDVFEPASRH